MKRKIAMALRHVANKLDPFDLNKMLNDAVARASITTAWTGKQ